MQKATYLKCYKNFETSRKPQGNSFVALDNDYLMHVTSNMYT